MSGKECAVGLSSAPVQWEIYERLDQKPLDPAQGAASSKRLLALYKEAGIDVLHAQLLYNRGLREQADMHRFLQASLGQLLDPYGLADMHRAVSRIQQAIQQREHITVFGDFDADGVTS